MAGAEGF